MKQAAEKLPILRYQVQFASGDVERFILDSGEYRTGIRNFLNSLYGGRLVSNGDFAFSAIKGVPLGEEVGESKILHGRVSILFEHFLNMIQL